MLQELAVLGHWGIGSKWVKRDNLQLYPTIKSPEKDTRQMDLGNAPDGNP